MPAANFKNTSIWTDERKEYLVVLYNDSRGFSAAEITRKLNKKYNTTFSRNAVIGKINRLGLREKNPGSHALRKVNKIQSTFFKQPKEGKPVRPQAAPVGSLRETFRQKDTAELAAKFSATVEDAPAKPITIDELTAETCKWPLGKFEDRPPYMFCGARVAHERLPYCAKHVHAQTSVDWRQPRPMRNKPYPDRK